MGRNRQGAQCTACRQPFPRLRSRSSASEEKTYATFNCQKRTQNCGGTLAHPYRASINQGKLSVEVGAMSFEFAVPDFAARVSTPAFAIASGEVRLK
jgi:hypothetical protein